MTKSSAHLGLETCSPQELSSWLLASRFDGDEMAVTTFLLESVSSLPNARAISDQLVRESSPPTASCAPPPSSGEEEKVPSDLLGELGSRTRPEDLAPGTLCVSLSNPRGKFDVEWYENGLAFAETKTPSSRIAVAKGTVEKVVVFPKPEDMVRAKHRGSGSKGKTAATATSSMMLIVFRHGANCTFRNKRIQQVCLQLPSAPASGAAESIGDRDILSSEGDAFVQCVTERLDLTDPSQVVMVSRESTFRSHSEAGTSTTTSGMPFLNCYHGVNDGVVFPLSKGLLFVKPPIFVPVETIHSIAVGSRNFSGGRYIDLDLVVKPVGRGGSDEMESSVQFTNIHKDEAQGLNQYIQSLVREVGPDESVDPNSSPASSADVPRGDEDGSTSPPVDASSKPRNGRPPPRRAGVVASATFRNQSMSHLSDDDEDGDDDFVAIGKPGEGENSDDDGTDSECGINDDDEEESSTEDVEPTEDESTESESEGSADATDVGGEKSSKRARRT